MSISSVVELESEKLLALVIVSLSLQVLCEINTMFNVGLMII